MTKLRSINSLLLLAIIFAPLFAMPALATQSGTAGVVVGEMITVIGMGKIVNPQGEQAAERGKVVRAGDRIETTAGGHVHVRFVDGALVSIRPLSRLHIEDYRNSDTQNQAAIKFRLEEGVIRSVTGQWGEAHRDRFRINTPIAAIGIKGTDFILKANSSSTLASVNSGAIVMAPLEGSCASGLGPCSGERSALLTASMQGTMLEYLKQNDASTPRLIPYVDLLARNSSTGSNNSAPQPIERRPTEALQSSAPTESALVTKAPPSSTNVASVSNIITDIPVKETVVATVAVAPVIVTPVVIEIPVVIPPVVIATPVVPEVPPTPTSLPMAWIHNVSGWNVSANSISTRFNEASLAGRTAVVGNFFINLYRDEITPKDFTPPKQTANFTLQSASANFDLPIAYGRPSEIVTVSGATLSVDFVRSTLTTQMDLTSAAIGKDHFVASATITPAGIFTDNTGTQKIAGAFSTDARQAGYLFEKSINNGRVSGLTLWGR